MNWKGQFTQKSIKQKSRRREKMDRMEIERNLRPGEEGFRRVGTKTYNELFFDDLHNYEQKYTKLHQPFDRACARIDFLDRYDVVLREIERGEGSVSDSDPRLKIDFGGLDKYALIERFDKIGEAEDMVNRNVDGMIMPIQISVTELFICKHRRHQIAVQIPLDVWKKRKAEEEKPLVKK